MIAHSNPMLVRDSIEAIQCHLTDDILVLLDSANKEFTEEKLPCRHVIGLPHGCPRAPYRNKTLAIKTASNTFKDVDYLLYLEPDVLISSNVILDRLEKSKERGVWCLGSDHRRGNLEIPFIDKLIGKTVTESHYLLGCCIFYHMDFLRKLHSLDFFDRFLWLTNNFQDGFYPNYPGYDIDEHLYPTMAVALGGVVEGLAYCRDDGKWMGNWRDYPLRFRPEIGDEALGSCIAHPVKRLDHPARRYQRSIRRKS